MKRHIESKSFSSNFLIVFSVTSSSVKLEFIVTSRRNVFLSLKYLTFLPFYCRLSNFSSMHGLQYILGKEYDSMEAARNKALKGSFMLCPVF